MKDEGYKNISRATTHPVKPEPEQEPVTPFGLPLFWDAPAPRPDGSLINEGTKKPEQEPLAWAEFDGEGGYHFRAYENNEDYAEQWDKRNPNHVGWVKPLYTTPPQRPSRSDIKPLTDWIDPNDKTQERFLPNIGEPVLFCHEGKTYYGKHNGGSFQCGYGVTKRYYNTWECRWMYLPAAHGIKE